VLSELNPERGVFLVANHRSFFDFYAVSSVLLRLAPWVERLYFPVRSSFFYERPLGVFVNAVMSAMAMYPPVMREGPKRAFNQYTVDLIAELVQQRGGLAHDDARAGAACEPDGVLAHAGDVLPVVRGVGALTRRARGRGERDDHLGAHGLRRLPAETVTAAMSPKRITDELPQHPELPVGVVELAGGGGGVLGL
jgi:hypothetical protein